MRNRDESGEIAQPGMFDPDSTVWAVSAEAIGECPGLAACANLLATHGEPASRPVDAMRTALRERIGIGAGPAKTIVVIAACEPILESDAAGTLYQAMDYVNFHEDNPLIGIQPPGHVSFFLDMKSPFITAWPTAPPSSIRDAILAGWPEQKPLDDSARARLRSLGVEIVSAHGVNEAIAARALGLNCMALFYARGDREGTRSLTSYLSKADICNNAAYRRDS